LFSILIGLEGKARIMMSQWKGLEQRILHGIIFPCSVIEKGNQITLRVIAHDCNISCVGGEKGRTAA
jgi:hypothetical protein